MADMLKELTDLHERMQDPDKWAITGICAELDDPEGFRDLAEAWPKYSGEEDYPVPAAIHKGTAEGEYMCADSNEMWDRENSFYAELRWQLLEWTIAQLEKAND